MSEVLKTYYTEADADAAVAKARANGYAQAYADRIVDGTTGDYIPEWLVCLQPYQYISRDVRIQGMYEMEDSNA